MSRWISSLLLVLAALGGSVAYWALRPLPLDTASADLAIEPGMTPRQVAQEAVRAGVNVNADLLYLLFRLSGRAREIKAGSYELAAPLSAWSLLNKLVRGEESLLSITLVEGWNMRQLRAALKEAPQLRSQIDGVDDAALMKMLGRSDSFAEGRFYPDTYTYAKGSTDLALLRRAAHAMDRKLAWVWSQRDASVPLQSPEQALVLASLIEKETGFGPDRPMVAAVFANRLRLGMRLQTDPSVIYGLGALYTGGLHKADLLKDSAWNTYTRAGLPPTPIALPGKASLLAAVRPAHTSALYFVARGDGSSYFSDTLDEHNRAVNKYLRNGQ